MSIFDVSNLHETAHTLKTPPLFLLNNFFPTPRTFPGVHVEIDRSEDSNQTAPLVSPMAKGKILEDKAYQSFMVKPGYYKPKGKFNPEQAITRLAGEDMRKPLTAEGRRARILAEMQKKQVVSIQRALEVQAAEVLVTGKVVLESEDFPKQQIDFQRDAALTASLGSDYWGTVSADVGSDITMMCDLMEEKGSAAVTDIIMNPTTWAAMRKDKDYISDRVDPRRGGDSTLDLGTRTGKVNFIGRDGDVNIWTYNDSYTDASGVVRKYIPDGKVVFISAPLIEGRQYFAQVQDEDAFSAGIQEAMFFPKSWKEEDPACRMVMTQSAPLVGPLRPNATACLTVFA